MAATLGWGIAGTGDVSRYICSDLALLDSAARVAVASRDRERAVAFAAEHGFERGSIFEDLLSDESVDIVYIATPHSTHVDLAMAALRAGKHVLIEKPLGVDAADVERLIAAAREAQRFAMEAMWVRFSPHYRSLLAEVREGTIGRMGGMRASFGLPFHNPDSTHWSAEKRSSTLLDQGIYPVTLASDLFGIPTSIQAGMRTRADGVDFSVYATLGYAGGEQAQLAASMIEYIDPSASINGEAGWISIPAPFWATDKYTRHSGAISDAFLSPMTIMFEREGFGYVPMLRAVTEAVLGGEREHPLHPLAQTKTVTQILDTIRAAAHPLTTENHA